MCNPGYAPLLDAAINAIQPLHASALFRHFAQFYETVSEDRGRRYFDLMRDFFSADPELSQVYFFVLYGPLEELRPIRRLLCGRESAGVPIGFEKSPRRSSCLVDIYAIICHLKYDNSNLHHDAHTEHCPTHGA